MGNIALALGMGVVAFAALYFPGVLKFAESLVPGVIAAILAYVFLARRTFRALERVFGEGAASLQSMPPKFDLAISTIEKAYKLAPLQLGIRSQVDTQIGVIYFLRQDFTKALPYLKRSLMFGHWLGGAMLGVVYYKKKDNDEMRKTFDVVTRRAKKQGLAWSLYAYLLNQSGDKDRAQRVLHEGVKYAGKEDPRVQELLLAMQNGKKLKMRVYKEQWYQFHLERPPTDYQQSPVGGGKMGRIARRGRWS